MADCLFCKMIQKEIKAKIEYEDDDFLVIHDINPQAPVHVLILTKKHIDGIAAMQESDIELLGKTVLLAKKLAVKNQWEHYRLVFNNGSEAGQSIFHIHLHLLSGRRMKWPPG